MNSNDSLVSWNIWRLSSLFNRSWARDTHGPGAAAPPLLPKPRSDTRSKRRSFDRVAVRRGELRSHPGGSRSLREFAVDRSAASVVHASSQDVHQSWATSSRPKRLFRCIAQDESRAWHRSFSVRPVFAYFLLKKFSENRYRGRHRWAARVDELQAEAGARAPIGRQHAHQFPLRDDWLNY